MSIGCIISRGCCSTGPGRAFRVGGAMSGPLQCIPVCCERAGRSSAGVLAPHRLRCRRQRTSISCSSAFELWQLLGSGLVRPLRRCSAVSLHIMLWRLVELHRRHSLAAHEFDCLILVLKHRVVGLHASVRSLDVVKGAPRQLHGVAGGPLLVPLFQIVCRWDWVVCA